MSRRAKFCRAAGTIVDGRIRDLQEHRDLDYPVRLDSICTGIYFDQKQVFANDIGTAAPQELLRVSEVKPTQRRRNPLPKSQIKSPPPSAEDDPSR